MAVALAESPSVKINVHLFDSFVPALLASSNLGIPEILTLLWSRRCIYASLFALRRCYGRWRTS